MSCDQVSNWSSSSMSPVSNWSRMSASSLNRSIWLSPMAAKKDNVLKNNPKNQINPKSKAILYMQHADLYYSILMSVLLPVSSETCRCPWAISFSADLEPPNPGRWDLQVLIFTWHFCRFRMKPVEVKAWFLERDFCRTNFWNQWIKSGGFGFRQGRFPTISFETRRSLNHYP